jgi:hypothetical protein
MVEKWGDKKKETINPVIVVCQHFDIMSRFYLFPLYLEEPIGYPAQPGLICQSVHACRLDIQQKMAQAQQIWSIIL